MKTLGMIGSLIILAVLLWGWGYVWLNKKSQLQLVDQTDHQEKMLNVIDNDQPLISKVAEDLTIPWEVLFLPDKELLITERPGSLILLKEGVEIPVAGVRHIGEGGLLGAALHPDFVDNRWLYLYQTSDSDQGLVNRVVRYRLADQTIELDRVIVDDIPGARNHDGGRIAFGPDGNLYITTGDAGNEAIAQDVNNLAGKILRVTAEGEIPADNPFNNAVYSYGHRNPQGLAWDDVGRLWSTEHGRSGIRSGFDEINLIEPGGNYGWPESQGDTVVSGTVAPKRHSGGSNTWAPGGLAFLDGYLYIPSLRGETLYRASVAGAELGDWQEYFVGEYGRLRTVTVGPDGLLYLTTSNQDGRTNDVTSGDDRLLRVDPGQL